MFYHASFTWVITCVPRAGPTGKYTGTGTRTHTNVTFEQCSGVSEQTSMEQLAHHECIPMPTKHGPAQGTQAIAHVSDALAIN